MTAYNRCASLAAKAGAEAAGAVDAGLFAAPAEAELHDAVAAAREPLLEQLEHLEIASAIATAATLRPPSTATSTTCS